VEQLLQSLWLLVSALGAVAQAGWNVALPTIPVVVWAGFWGCLVNWAQFRPLLVERGGWVVVVLLGILAAASWSALVPADGVVTGAIGLRVQPITARIVDVTALLAIAWGCGTVQLLSTQSRSTRPFPKENSQLNLPSPRS
jgi:hypothetical protein